MECAVQCSFSLTGLGRVWDMCSLEIARCDHPGEIQYAHRKALGVLLGISFERRAIDVVCCQSRKRPEIALNEGKSSAKHFGGRQTCQAQPSQTPTADLNFRLVDSFINSVLVQKHCCIAPPRTGGDKMVCTLAKSARPALTTTKTAD